MSANNKLSVINSTIKSVAAAEKVTKKGLSMLSRSLLDYVLIDAGTTDGGKARELGDIDAINRTLAVLTPVNKSVATLYFRHFLPYSFNEETCEFGKMNKKQKKAKVELVTKWLAIEENDIWAWSEDNIDVAKKPVALGEDITKAVQRALSGTEETRTKQATEALTLPQIFDAIIAGGVDAAGLIEMLTQDNVQDKAA